VSACVSVCLSARISPEPHARSIETFLCVHLSSIYTDYSFSSLLSLCCTFTAKYVGERMLNIGQHLAKLEAKI